MFCVRTAVSWPWAEESCREVRWTTGTRALSGHRFGDHHLRERLTKMVRPAGRSTLNQRRATGACTAARGAAPRSLTGALKRPKTGKTSLKVGGRAGQPRRGRGSVAGTSRFNAMARATRSTERSFPEKWAQTGLKTVKKPQKTRTRGLDEAVAPTPPRASLWSCPAYRAVFGHGGTKQRVAGRQQRRLPTRQATARAVPNLFLFRDEV